MPAGGSDGGSTADSGNPVDGGSTSDSGGPADGPAAMDTGGGDGYVPPPPGPVCTPPVGPPDTSHPTSVVGTGAGTCNETLLAAAVAKGGIITFDCGSSATIPIMTTLTLRTDVDTVIDGGAQVTLDGGGTTQIMSFNHANYRMNTVQLTVMNITLSHGKISGTMRYAPAPAPCSQGYYDGYGGALFVRDGEVLIVNTVFEGNTAEQLVYSIEKLIKENEDKLPEDVKNEVQGDVDGLKTALAGEDEEAVKTAFDKLNASQSKLGEAIYASSQAEASAPSDAPADEQAAGQPSDEDVIDAEVVEDEEKK